MDTTQIATFIGAFIVVLGLMGAVFFLLRRFGSGQLGGTAGRGRQPRLAVIDAAAVDARRRLILIRRDNVEHLLMIGGPSDVVVEANIVRTPAPSRDAAGARPSAPGDALPRPVPIGDANMWPLQPEPAPPPRAQRPPAYEEPVQWHPEPEPPSLPPLSTPSQRRPEPRPADPLVGLAAELSRQPAQPEPLPPLRTRPSREREMTRARASQLDPVRAAPPPPSDEPFAPSPNTDQNLAEMAQRLEAALRRPKSTDARASDQPSRPAAMTPPMMPPPSMAASEPAAAGQEAPPERGELPPPPHAAQTVVRPTPKSAPQKSVYDSLEQEMASLLGRPNSKN